MMRTFILIDYHFYISDDHRHDSEFVQHCFKLHWGYIFVHNFLPTWHYVCSNGCATQFKSSKLWYFVSQYPNMMGG
jgi:hypothetical protein